MTLQTCTVHIAGLELFGAYDGKDYFVGVVAFEQQLDVRANSTREIVASKGLKTALGKELALGKKRVGTSYMSFIPANYFAQLVGYVAYQQNNKKAQALLMAVLGEAVERRIDKALGQIRTEDDYENQTRAFYRELARKSFQPELCSWFASQHAINYGAEVNLFKRSLKLPLVNVDSFDPTQMHTWARGINSYNALRMEGFSHTRALRAVGNHAAARLDSL